MWCYPYIPVCAVVGACGFVSGATAPQIANKWPLPDTTRHSSIERSSSFACVYGDLASDACQTNFSDQVLMCKHHLPSSFWPLSLGLLFRSVVLVSLCRWLRQLELNMRSSARACAARPVARHKLHYHHTIISNALRSRLEPCAAQLGADVAVRRSAQPSAGPNTPSPDSPDPREALAGVLAMIQVVSMLAVVGTQLGMFVERAQSQQHNSQRQKQQQRLQHRANSASQHSARLTVQGYHMAPPVQPSRFSPGWFAELQPLFLVRT